MAQVDLSEKFPEMKPIKGAPSLARINGCGTGILGKRNVDAETGAYVTTLCITLLFVPIFCLKAYRVARADRGWYFLGTEPLSIAAKTYNFVVLLAIVSIVGGVAWTSYTGTDAYKAARQMSEAKGLVEQGHLGQAAEIYKRLAMAGADQASNATNELKELTDKKLGSAPLSEAAGVLAAAGKLSGRDTAMPSTEIVAKGLELVKEKGESDPRGALVVLDAIHPLAVDTRPIDSARLPLLKKWAATEPTNLEVVVPLASLLEQQNQLDEARKLLLPVKDRLGDGEGARVLGLIYTRDGDYDAAYGLLWPYVKARLEKLHTAEKAVDGRFHSLWERETRLLQDNKGPESFYTKYKAAGSEDAKDAVLRDYIYPRIKGDPALASDQEKLSEASSVVPVALELGIVSLQRAQGQANPAERKKQLESAEQVFLSIQDFAGKSDEYRLYLGQVYYWLGKQADGRKLFDDYLASKGRSVEALNDIAYRLYDLGAEPECRAACEEAYGKATKSEDQHRAAIIRARCSKDVDDEIEWLNKCDLLEPSTRARLATVLGQKAYSEGRDEDAAKQYRAAISVYEGLPRSSHSLNETALGYDSLYQATGDHTMLERCVDLVQQAVALSPSDSTLIFNGAATISEATVTDILSKDIDLRALRQSGHFGLLIYLYNNQAERDALAQRLKEHPGTARAMSYLEKSMVLSPKSFRAYWMVYQFDHYTNNEEGLRGLEKRLSEANVDASDQITGVLDYINGVKDAKTAASITASVKRAEALSDALRPRGDRTAAVAICQYAEQLQSLDTFTHTTDANKVVALAAEAYKMSPSTGTEGMLFAAYVFRASKELCRTEPAFEALHTKYSRSIGDAYLMLVTINTAGPLREKILANADVQKAAALEMEDLTQFPANPGLTMWIMQKSTDAAAGEKTAEIIRKNTRRYVDQAVTTLLAPASAPEAIETYWLMQIQGKEGEGRKALEKVAALGIPIPMQP